MIIGMFALFLTFAVYGMFTFDLSIQEMKKLLSSRNEGFAFNMMQDLDRFIDKRINDFKLLAKDDLVQKTVKDSNQEFRGLHDIESYVKSRESEIEDSNQPVPFIDSSLNIELSQDLLDTIQFYRAEYNYDVVKEIFVTNEYGANIALGYGTTDYRQEDEEWWQSAKNTGISLGKLTFDERYDAYVVPVGIRIDDDNGNFIGIMRVLITLDDLIHDFGNDADIITIPGREVYLLDEQRRVIFHNGIQESIDSKPVSYAKELENKTDVGTIEIGQNRDVTIISFAKSTGYRTFEGFDWIIVVYQSDNALVGEFENLRDSILIVSFIGMIASIVIGLVIAFIISEPLRRLSLMAKAISVGKFGGHVKKSKIDEINVIGDSFNQMTDSLKKLIETEKDLAYIDKLTDEIQSLRFELAQTRSEYYNLLYSKYTK